MCHLPPLGKMEMNKVNRPRELLQQSLPRILSLPREQLWRQPRCGQTWSRDLARGDTLLSHFSFTLFRVIFLPLSLQ